MSPVDMRFPTRSKSRMTTSIEMPVSTNSEMESPTHASVMSASASSREMPSRISDGASTSATRTGAAAAELSSPISFNSSPMWVGSNRFAKANQSRSRCAVPMTHTPQSSTLSATTPTRPTYGCRGG